ncbi:hypothetical protein IAG41_15740 [Sphingomonas sp. JC676]|uniref:hypothetical protein n=1 Tax=Sphingomonas sp. JC676 TaxID=2768065 RepID=UPI001657D8FE|nr:hypothetical protein [Sphingomonas sp. JC676]MBC9033847.1 hypothetical protein [Sphingomonas sp. JC676]
MAFEIKQKGPDKAPPRVEDKFDDAIHLSLALIEQRNMKTRVTLTNLKTGETLNEAQIHEAALSVGPRKRRPEPEVADSQIG